MALRDFSPGRTRSTSQPQELRESSAAKSIGSALACGGLMMNGASSSALGPATISNADLPLATYHFGTVDTLGRIAGVDDQLGLVDDLFVVVIGVIGDDHDAIKLPQFVQFRALHL